MNHINNVRFIFEVLALNFSLVALIFASTALWWIGPKIAVAMEDDMNLAAGRLMKTGIILVSINVIVSAGMGIYAMLLTTKDVAVMTFALHFGTVLGGVAISTTVCAVLGMIFWVGMIWWYKRGLLSQQTRLMESREFVDMGHQEMNDRNGVQEKLLNN